MELLVKLLTDLAWPIVAIWIAYLFKGALCSLLGRMSQLKYRDVEATFERNLAAAEATAVPIKKYSQLAEPHPEILSQFEQLRRSAEVSPRSAILEAWMLLEAAARKSGFTSGSVIQCADVTLLVKELVLLGKIPIESDLLVHEMRKLRNQAAHLPDFSLSQDEADRYLQLASLVSGIILNVMQS